jgi:transcriptional regulator GlxA family with amidase domain
VQDVTVVLFDDGLASTAVLPMEIFHTAGALWAQLHGQPPAPRFRVRTASLTGAPVRTPYGALITPEVRLDEVERTDIVIVPTSGLDLDVKLLENSAILPWLRRHHASGAYVAGVCMGAAYLAEAGLLDGRIGTTHWALGETFAARYPKVRWRPDQFVTEDGRLLCSGGVMAAMDVSLYLVEKLCGHEIAVQTAKALLMSMPRTHQSGYAVLPLSAPHDDAGVRDIEAYVQGAFHQDLSVEGLATRAGLGERTFVRRFKAATGQRPGAYLQAVRIEAAKKLLEREARSIQAVSSAVGYDDVAFFRKLVKRATGMTPAEYRQRFGALHVRSGPFAPARPSDGFAAGLAALADERPLDHEVARLGV